jgi:alpha-glucosidase (family GH31 glycosyl hydrolase)
MKEKSPDDLISKYFKIIGKPVMIPQWALGWNQCRWGYRNLSMLEEVVKGYSDYSIPLDVQWSDIDYLNKYRNFEYDTVSFNGLPTFVANLHTKNMRWVPILDAGLAYRPDGSYSHFTTG